MIITKYVKEKRWECFPTAFAMLGLKTSKGITLEPTDVMAAIGHDGSEITHAGLPEPLKRRGFHIQEIIDVALQLGYAMTEIQHSPQLVSVPLKSTMAQSVSQWCTSKRAIPFQIKEGDDASCRFQYHIDTSQGILSTQQKTGKSHAWAYEDGTIYDPDGNHAPMAFNEKDLAAFGHFPVALWRVDRITD